jgi:hypothetical protein
MRTSKAGFQVDMRNQSILMVDYAAGRRKVQVARDSEVGWGFLGRRESRSRRHAPVTTAESATLKSGQW